MRQPRKNARPADALKAKPDAPPKKTLVCGYGNPGRRDDGLGPALIARLEEEPGLRGRQDLQTESRLQLNVEDALTISGFDRVIFVDASRRGRAAFEFRRVRPARHWTFSTHALGPGSVLALCRELYGKSPQAYLLTIRGYAWELGENLSARAARGLSQAVRFLLSRLQLREGR